MLQAIGAVFLWGVAPSLLMLMASLGVQRRRAPTGRALSILLALQLAISAVLTPALPELAAAALFADPPQPDDLSDVARGLFLAGTTLLLGAGLAIALVMSAGLGIARLRSRAAPRTMPD